MKAENITEDKKQQLLQWMKYKKLAMIEIN